MDVVKILERLSEGWQVKTFATVVFTYLFGEYNAGLGALAILIMLDWLTKWWGLSKEAGGFWIAWKTNAISSRGMRAGLPKIFWYIVLLIAAHQLEQFKILGHTVGQAPKEIVSAYLALIESKSILENLRNTGMAGLDPLIKVLGKKQNQVTGEKD